ncbi:MAG TPA: Hsp20/alpha crystallin family protein [Nitrososphaerales archaeon]|nr:Hsp20/alpha crystallin family protein [Nitrososphaerales archaeon]
MTDKKNEDKSRRPEDDSTALALPNLGFPSIFEEFMRPFDQFMEPFFPKSMRSFWTEMGGKEPIVDLQDRGDLYLLTAELPGFEKKDVEVKIDSNTLEVKAEKSVDKQTKSKDGTMTQRSRSYFHRYLTLPEEVVSEKVSGTMKNGVLELKLPKRAPKLSDNSRRVDLK